jgi:uncharacterized protein (DUF362 family)
MNKKVAIVKTAGNEAALLRDAVRRALDLLDSPLKDVGPGDTVVIKPNITADSISWRQGIVTNTRLVRAIIELVAERNPREILIAEAIAIGLDVKKAYSFLGYDKIARATGVRLVDLYDEEFVDIPVTGSNLHSTLQIAKMIVEADFLINVPVMKTHVAVGISVCMKNLMGTISREQKRKFHFFGIAESVIDLNSVVKPHLSIADGTVAGEGDGPMANEPIGFETLVAGTLWAKPSARPRGHSGMPLNVSNRPKASSAPKGGPVRLATERSNWPWRVPGRWIYWISSNRYESFAVQIQARPVKAKMCSLSENACPTSMKPATLSPVARRRFS